MGQDRDVVGMRCEWEEKNDEEALEEWKMKKLKELENELKKEE